MEKEGLVLAIHWYLGAKLGHKKGEGGSADDVTRTSTSESVRDGREQNIRTFTPPKKRLMDEKCSLF